MGRFARWNLRIWNGTYYAIDSWTHREDGSHDLNEEDQDWHDLNFNTAAAQMAFAGARVKQVRMLSKDAGSMFPEEFFDWIYIDALHTEVAVSEDLNIWWPKLRPGGLMSGDDYVDLNSTEYLPANRIGGLNAMYAKMHNFGVIRATQAFAAKVGAVLSTTFLNSGPNCNDTPGWYIVKPPDVSKSESTDC